MKQLAKCFRDNLGKIYSASELAIIKKGFETNKRNTTFRINTLISQHIEVLDILSSSNIEIVPLKGIPNSYSLVNLEDEKKLWGLDIIKRGLIYVQGHASQIPVHTLNVSPGMRVLDLAAAPGGKTTQLSEKLENTGSIIALENSQIRMDKLLFTINRQGAKNVDTLKIDSRNYAEVHEGENFDAILFDAPCSAEGRINLAEEKSYGFVSEANNKKNYKLQRDIVKSNLHLLKPGGELVYSTCTLMPQENEGIVHFILCNFPDLEISEIDSHIFGDLDTKAGITHFGDIAYKKEVSKSMRILPSVRSEGFFIAKFKKKIL